MPISTRLIALATASILAVQPLSAQQDSARPPTSEEAPIAYLLDLTSGQVLLAREADRRFMPASITKVMTTFLAFEWIEEGRLVPRQVYTVDPQVWDEWNNVGSTMFLPNRARVTVDDLIHGVTTVSANDGAAMLAHGAAGSIDAWVAEMNEKARETGMRDSHFGTPNGWMDNGKTFTTARDLGLLAASMIRKHPSKYRHYVGRTEFTYNGITQPNHDPISGRVPGADGIKTGFTNQAGYGFLGSAERNGRRLVMVVAASPRSSVRDRAARELLEWGFGEFEQKQLLGRGAILGEAQVQGGDAGTVDLVAPGGVYISLPEGSDPEVRLSISYRGPLRAPIAENEQVAELLIEAEGIPEYRVSLHAAAAVGKAGFLDRMANGIRGWLR